MELILVRRGGRRGLVRRIRSSGEVAEEREGRRFG